MTLINGVEAPNDLQSVQVTAPPAGRTPATNRTQPPLSDASTTISVQVNANTGVKSEAANHNFPKAAASAEKGAKGKGTARIFRNPRNLPRGSVSSPFYFLLLPTNSEIQNGNHRPVGPRGSVVLKSENVNLDQSKAQRGKIEPKKLVLRFKDVKGNIHEHSFPGRAAKKWNDDQWIASLNKWRYQTFNRKFKYDPSVKHRPRGKWTMAEKEYLKQQLEKKIEESGNRLIGNDWKEIANLHNARFSGTKVKKGEKLLKGEAAKDYTITDRSALAIRAAYDKMPDLVQFVEDLVAEYTDDEGEEEENGDKMEGIIEENHGGQLDHHLEDPSDDEDDGRRPASNTTGAILVEGAC
jgi:hypothetical protein